MLKKITICSLSAATLVFGAQIRLDTTVISTSGFETKLKDEVRNVIVITSEDIQNKGYKNVEEILEAEPSISFIDPGFGRTIDMRGQGINSNFSTKIMLNGVALNMLDTSHATVPINTISVDDIEQIEIIPGGGSVLYGNGTSGGVINIITKNQPRDFYTNLSTKFGSYNYKDLNFAVGGMANDDLFLKFNAKKFDEKGYRDGEKNRGYYTSGGATYQINDNQSIVLNSSYYNATTSTLNALSKAQVNSDPKQGGKKTTKDETRLDLTLDYALKYGDYVDFHIFPYYQKIKQELDDNSGFEDKKYGINLKNRMDYGNGELIYGYEYYINKGLRYRNNQGSRRGVTVKNSINVDLEKKSHSIYVMDNHHFNDWFSISSGYRFEKASYDLDRSSITNIYMPNSTRPMTTVKNIANQPDTNNHAFEITPNLKYSDTGNIYFKFERGFYSASPTQLTNSVRPQGATRGSVYKFNNLKSEIFYTYEIGAKDYFLGSYMSATAFITDKKNEIRNIMEEDHTLWRFINLDKTRRLGIELYASQYMLDNDLSLKQTYSYVDAKITSGEFNNKRIPLAAKHKLVFGADYKVIRNLNVFGDIKYFSDMLDNGYEKINSKTIVDIGAKYSFPKGFLVIAGIKNLFDKRYFTYQDKIKDQYKPANARNYYVEFKYVY
ncbi:MULTISPECIES: TonB-dependent receptor [Campylobacter]|uniref:TonB-dependent receptor n=1 Tax=Campylobacter TaxID=194 RepID=UPI00138E283D|nr:MULTISPECIES: TonB-dependent receptor [Campylobacter]MDV2489804.1 TonB-dependent receptor [Campylobacter sp. TJR-1]